jgi:ubiquinone/menaquinone biosynthesis C-methylase UbiE
MMPLEKNKFQTIRKHLISEAMGRVLEIGSGTGANFLFYDKVSSVVAIEPNPDMLKKSIPKAQKQHVSIHPHIGDAETLSYPDHSFDTVVGTLVFCTIPNPDKALNEIRRVLKPGGKLLLFEHVRLNHSSLGILQDLLTPAWKRFCDGCCLNRNTLQLTKRAGFHVGKVDSIYKGLFLIIQLENPNTYQKMQ